MSSSSESYSVTQELKYLEWVIRKLEDPSIINHANQDEVAASQQRFPGGREQFLDSYLETLKLRWWSFYAPCNSWNFTDAELRRPITHSEIEHLVKHVERLRAAPPYIRTTAADFEPLEGESL